MLQAPPSTNLHPLPPNCKYKSITLPSTTLPTRSSSMAVQRRTGLVALKHMIKKLHNHLHPSRIVDITIKYGHEEDDAEEERVPEDVKEGQFAVVAKKDKEKPMRFVAELSVLEHPAFLKLLEMAEDEFGFRHSGALELPCQPEELRRILQES